MSQGKCTYCGYPEGYCSCGDGIPIQGCRTGAHDKWKEENKDAIEQIWKSSHSLGFAMICNVCGGGSISTCACAKQKFYETMTPDTLAKMIKEKEAEEKWCLEHLEKMKK